MTASIAVNALLLIHLGFVLFVALGGLLVLKWRRAAWIHLPCAAWGILIEFTGWICPLLPIRLRSLTRPSQRPSPERPIRFIWSRMCGPRWRRA